jgi:hypothetical protein
MRRRLDESLRPAVGGLTLAGEAQENSRSLQFRIFELYWGLPGLPLGRPPAGVLPAAVERPALWFVP